MIMSTPVATAAAACFVAVPGPVVADDEALIPRLARISTIWRTSSARRPARPDIGLKMIVACFSVIRHLTFSNLGAAKILRCKYCRSEALGSSRHPETQHYPDK